LKGCFFSFPRPFTTPIKKQAGGSGKYPMLGIRDGKAAFYIYQAFKNQYFPANPVLIN
jgi:hypothetical protein